MLDAYVRLSEFYDKGEWGAFSLKYLGFIAELRTRFGFEPHSVLDISCGTGVLVNALSHAYEAEGSDISSTMIALARRAFPGSRFTVAAMADARGTRPFDVVVSPFDSVNYLLETGDLTASFANIASLLGNGGWFLFDFNTPAFCVERHKGCFRREVGSDSFTQVCRYDPMTRIAETEFAFEDGEREVHRQRAYSLSEMKSCLEAVGFRVEHSFDIAKNAEPDKDPWKILLYAQKPPTR